MDFVAISILKPELMDTMKQFFSFLEREYNKPLTDKQRDEIIRSIEKGDAPYGISRYPGTLDYYPALICQITKLAYVITEDGIKQFSPMSGSIPFKNGT